MVTAVIFNMKQTLEIDYYTDLLCVWAWIAQRRIEQLKDDYGDKIHFNEHFYRYLPTL